MIPIPVRELISNTPIPFAAKYSTHFLFQTGSARSDLFNKMILDFPFPSSSMSGFLLLMGVLEINSRTGMGIKSIQGLVQEVCKEKIERDRKRGIVNRPVRAMVVGIPNVGKSTFINSFAGKACAKTGNKPGVTKGKQWIRLNKGLELLDTPGILWPKFEDQQVGMRLAFIGSMNDEILIPDELACDLIGAIKELYPKALQERYAADPVGKPIEILEAVAESRKCYSKGEQLDLVKASGLLIDDFRSGKLGRMTLERIDSDNE